jgi:integrase
MRKIPDTITEEEFLKVLLATKKPHHKLAYVLGFYQAMRISEVLNLKPEDIDLGRKLIKIKEAKGMKDRNIPISPNAIKGLKHLPIKCGRRALQYAFKRKAKEVLGKDLHFHTLRHSGATYYFNIKKWDIRAIQVFLGHSKLDTTSIYTHVNPENLTKLMWG